MLLHRNQEYRWWPTKATCYTGQIGIKPEDSGRQGLPIGPNNLLQRANRTQTSRQWLTRVAHRANNLLHGANRTQTRRQWLTRVVPRATNLQHRATRAQTRRQWLTRSLLMATNLLHK
jgi:hypothetical protein